MGELWLVRHGETAWSREGRHTGRTDVPLTDRGQEQARGLRERLHRPWSLALTSPLSRAEQTAALAGVAAEPDDDLVEWAYGPAEGRTTAELSERTPWSVWDDVPLGETVGEVAVRCRQALRRVGPALAEGDVCLVAHGHLLRILTTVWLGLAPRDGRLLALGPARICVLGHEHETPVVQSWNT